MLHGLFRLQAHGVENLPAEGGFVLAANHTSNFDPWPLGLPLWPKRQLFFMAKAELFNPILGPPLRAGGAFPVRRGEADVEAVQTAVELCRGRRGGRDVPGGDAAAEGPAQEVRAQAADRLGADRAGSRRAARPGSDQGNRPAVAPARSSQVAYGEPVPDDDLAGWPPREAHQVATERLMERIYALYEGM